MFTLSPTVPNAEMSELPKVAMIPVKIIREEPLPKPYSVIHSESHITKVEPAVRSTTITM